ncbi:MAG: YdcF family protein [Rhodospirillales bacterium]
MLGAKVHADGTASAGLHRRVSHAVRLWRQTPGSCLVMCGAGQADSPSEAAVMAALAISDGVPETDILLDERSINTFENIALGTRLLSDHGVSRLFIVTDRWHIPRAVMCCRALGINAVPEPVLNRTLTPSSILHACREIPALIKYLFWLPVRVKAFRANPTRQPAEE